MKEETKKSLYSVLNLMDFLETMDFLTVDMSKVNDVRKALFDCINAEKEERLKPAIQINDRYELISMLPAFFSNKKLFKTKKEVVDFIVTKLGITAARKWSQKTIKDIAGNVMIEIIEGNEELYKKSIMEINQYIHDKPNLITKTTKTKKSGNTFMNMWFDFFENYRKEKDDI